MKILVIGDPHGNLEKIKRIPKKGIDLILLTGDLGNADLMRKFAFKNIERERKGLSKKEASFSEERKMERKAYDSTIKIIKCLAKFAPIFTIYGNVEPKSYKDKKGYLELKIPFLTDSLKRIKNVFVINNRLRNFKGIRIGGLQYFVDTNWVKDFKPSDYKKKMKLANKDTNKAKKIMKNFGKIDILLHHQPPYNILDKVTFKSAPKHWKGKHAGSKVIFNYIKKYQPKYAFCGHIHESKRYKKIGKTNVYNLGVCGYKIIEF